MDDRQLCILGNLADKADNYLRTAKIPMPDGMKVAGMIQGLSELSEALKELYVELSGENPWQD